MEGKTFGLDHPEFEPENDIYWHCIIQKYT